MEQLKIPICLHFFLYLLHSFSLFFFAILVFSFLFVISLCSFLLHYFLSIFSAFLFLSLSPLLLDIMSSDSSRWEQESREITALS